MCLGPVVFVVSVIVKRPVLPPSVVGGALEILFIIIIIIILVSV